MKKLLTILTIIIFCTSGTAIAKRGGKHKSKHKEKTKIERIKKEKTVKDKEEEAKEDIEKKEKKLKKDKKKREKKVKKEKVKGKKTEPPAGIQKASEKGKGKKKGLFERWFGGSKKEKTKE